MDIRDQRITIAKHCEGAHEGCFTDYLYDLNAIRDAEIEAGIHDRDNLALRVKWINALRTIVSRRVPKNKTGSPLVSDIDLLTASSEERLEALVKALGLWIKQPTKEKND